MASKRNAVIQPWVTWARRHAARSRVRMATSACGVVGEDTSSQSDEALIARS